LRKIEEKSLVIFSLQGSKEEGREKKKKVPRQVLFCADSITARKPLFACNYLSVRNEAGKEKREGEKFWIAMWWLSAQRTAASPPRACGAPAGWPAIGGRKEGGGETRWLNV